jgi:hypothetical protein
VSSEFSQINYTTNSTWQHVNLSLPLSHQVTVSSYPYMYMWGGCSEFGKGLYCLNASSLLLRYNVENSHWDSLETNLAHCYSSGVLVGNNLYISGGMGENGWDYGLYKLGKVLGKLF